MRPGLLAKSREGVPRRVGRRAGTRSELAHDNPHADLLVLQGMAGNQAVTHLLASDAVRARARAGLGSVAAPLHPDVRTEMEARFGCDFGSIRVHQDSTAARPHKPFTRAPTPSVKTSCSARANTHRKLWKAGSCSPTSWRMSSSSGGAVAHPRPCPSSPALLWSRRRSRRQYRC